MGILPIVIKGKVIEGNHIGTGLDMPTANIFPDFDTKEYQNGVYYSQTCVDGIWHNSISNLGCKPTVQNTGEINLETFIFDKDIDLYDKIIEVKLLKFRRSEQKFANLNELSQTVKSDFDAARKFFLAM